MNSQILRNAFMIKHFYHNFYDVFALKLFLKNNFRNKFQLSLKSVVFVFKK